MAVLAPGPAAVAAPSPAPMPAPARAPAAAAPLALSEQADAAAPQGVSFVLHSVVFDGANALSPTDLARAWRGRAGTMITLKELRAIASRAEGLYAQAGYPFVAITVPPQQVEGGRVLFRVVEGKISDLTVLGLNETARRQATAAFTPLIGVSPLSSQQLEQAYASARSTPGLVVSGALRRGSQPGGMDLVVQAARQPWRVYANASNLYADPVGPWGAIVGADYFGASKYGDQASIQVSSSLDGGKQYSVRGSYSRRLNGVGTSAAVTVLAAQAKPQGSVAPLRLATQVLATRFELSQNFVQDGPLSIMATAALETNDQKTQIFTSEALSDDKLRILSLSAATEVRGDRSRAAASLEVRQGLDIAGASHAGSASLSRATADPQAALLRAKFEGETRMWREHAVVRVESQMTTASLTTPEQYLIGNLGIGRGYEPGAAFADEALAVSAEVRHGPLNLTSSIRAEPFVFLDAARLTNTKIDTERPFEHRTVWSYGAGVRFQAPGPLRIELIYAIPQTPPLGLGEKTPGPSVLLNVTAGLYDVFSVLHRRLASGSQQ